MSPTVLRLRILTSSRDDYPGEAERVCLEEGSAAYDFDDLTDHAGEKWAFVASGDVTGDGRTITLDQLAAFLEKSRDWLPSKLARWAAP